MLRGRRLRLRCGEEAARGDGLLCLGLLRVGANRGADEFESFGNSGVGLVDGKDVTIEEAHAFGYGCPRVIADTNEGGNKVGLGVKLDQEAGDVGG